MSLAFLDDAVAREFHPFALTRPCCELRAGALLVRQRWEMASGDATDGFVGLPHLADFDEPGAASAIAGLLRAGSIVVNSRCAVSLAALPQDTDAWSCGGRLAAVRLKVDTDPEALLSSGSLESLAGVGKPLEVDGVWIDRVWDLVRLLPELLTADLPRLVDPAELESSAGLTTLGEHPVLVESGANIEPYVVFDAQAGPILVRRDATIQSFTRLVGPCFIGEGTIVNGGRITGSAIGERCRVHGEISTSVFLGYSNKGHDGFIGHSVLGRWVNLGAGTVNSNLKNNYSGVGLWTPRGVERTGMQFLGAFLGDHAKTAIGTRLTTGAVVGTGANVYGSGITSRYVPPFAWGLDGTEIWDLTAFLETAERAMKRRDVALGEKGRRQLTRAWQLAVGGENTP
jgi:UDP-N-acetylglucosamine diphosphorylase / glucose-1-phosphate thymidylyltransferase / UDP-N-acetylgalactosamine diphosphorylase / glucosamine-1-phosphate N-acetyltransferase / galactosamine-1-phosphate N-acetyltransferase